MTMTRDRASAAIAAMRCGWPPWCTGSPGWRWPASCRCIFWRWGWRSTAKRGSTASSSWTANPLVKLAETGLVFLLAVHMLGGIRVLVIENLPWRDGQKQLAPSLR